MRAFTPMAVICWGARLGYLKLDGTWAIWVTTPGFLIVFTAAALGEYVWDTWPGVPARKTTGPLVGRIVLGALAGAVLATSVMEPIAGGMVFGVLGALVGAFGGYRARMYMARVVGRDLPVALTESALTLGMAVAVVLTFYMAYIAETFPSVLSVPR